MVILLIVVIKFLHVLLFYNALKLNIKKPMPKHRFFYLKLNYTVSSIELNVALGRITAFAFAGSIA